MKKFMAAFLSILLLLLCLTIITFLFTGCSDTSYSNEEYEVISVAAYDVITGKNEIGPVKETRLAFVYSYNGNPELVKDYHEIDSEICGNYIIVGEYDSNKYVIVNEYRSRTKYLYLTNETFNTLFPTTTK